MDRDRLLVFGVTGVDIRSLLTHLGQPPSKEDIQTVKLTTKYYSTAIDVWLDEADRLEDWSREWADASLMDVRAALKGLVYAFDFRGAGTLEADLNKLGPLTEALDIESVGDDDGNESWSGLKVCVGLGEIDGEFEDYEDVCLTNGWECIHLSDSRDFNEYKERVGAARFKEVVESHGWTITEEKRTTVAEEHNAMDLDQLVDIVKAEKQRIEQLPYEEREREAAKFIESLNLS